MEFLEELVVGQIADSALVTNEALSEITKVEQDITNALESEIKSIRDESEKANEKALKISEESNKEIEIINRKIIDLSNDTSNVDLFKEINDLKIQIEIKNDQIANLELENKKLSEKLSDFIFHYNSSNQMNKYNE